MAITNTQQMPQQPQQALKPTAKSGMAISPLNPEQQQRGLENEQTPDGKPEHLNLRGGCPGKLCGLPILPCHCDCWIIPLPCC